VTLLSAVHIAVKAYLYCLGDSDVNPELAGATEGNHVKIEVPYKVLTVVTMKMAVYWFVV
jgi:hypothetical protein